MIDVVLFEYQHKRVRSLTVDGQIWFVAKDVCNVLEIKNVSDATSRLDEDEKGIVTNDTLSTPQPMLIVSESGLYSLIWSSRKPEAKAFRRWITHEVLPQIRKTGNYISQPIKPMGILPLASHTNNEVQKTMSKAVNGFNIRAGGREAAVRYNVMSSLAHIGKTPSALIKEGKKAGLKSKDYSSGKAVARVLYKPNACCMSLADNLINEGHDEDKVFAITPDAEKLFKSMLELGAIPSELHQLDKKK